MSAVSATSSLLGRRPRGARRAHHLAPSLDSSRARSRRAQGGGAPTVAVSAAGASDVSSVDDPLSRLRGVSLKRATDGETVDASIVPSQGRVVVPFLTQFADFDSWELAQRLVDDIPALDAAGVTLVAVGIGSVDAAREFATRTNFLDRLYSDDSAAAYDALGFAPGFGREGGAFGWIGEKLPFVNGYAKLLVMCAKASAPPGTLAAVFGGYFGSKYRDPIFVEGSNYDNPTIRRLMDATLGGGYQRPFELATLRLTNMIEILRNWDALAPTDDELLAAGIRRVPRRPGRVPPR